MKLKTLSVLAGVGTPLILTAGAPAAFIGIKVIGKANSYGLLVCNVYAEFDRPGEDRMQAVAGTPNAPMLIEVLGGTFYNHQFGGTNNLAPDAALVAFFPSLAFDTFATIGVKSVGEGGQPMDGLTVTPGLPLLEGSSVYTTTSGWAVTPDLPQGDPFDPNYVAGNGQVLIGQFATADGTAVAATMLLQYVSNGQISQSVVSFFSVCPAPGAIALFGVAGLLPVRRRRRS